MQRPQARRPYAWLTHLIILMAVVAVVIGGIAVHYVETQLVATTGESLALAANDIADMLDRILFERYSDILMLSQAGVFHGRDRTAMNEYLATLKKIYPVYLRLGVTDADGRFIASTDPAGVFLDRSKSEWYRAVRDRGGIYVQDAQVFEDSGNALGVAFSAPINGSQGEFQGVVTSQVGIAPLVEVFVKALRAFQVQRGSEGKLEYQFLTRDGDVIADSILRQEGQVNLKQMGLLSALLIGSAQPGYVEEMHLRRRTPVVSGYAQTRGYGQFTGLHWGVLVRMDRSDILAPIHAILWKLGLLGAFLFIPLLGFLLWTTGRLRNEWEQARLRDRAIAAAENAIFITDPNQPHNPIIYVNPALESLTGYGKGEILGRSYRFLLTPDTDPTASEEIRMALWDERECNVAMTNYRKDGTPFWSEMTLSPVRDPRGRLTHYVGIVTDITELKRAEVRLAKINECFLSFGTDSKENINRLTGLFGELLGATCALYNRLEGGLLSSVGKWHTPPNLNPWGEPDGPLCHDVIRRSGDGLLVVRNLSQTPFAETDPNIKQFGLETYIGQAVKCGGTFTGSLCAVFQRDFILSEADERLMGIIASAIRVEEERELAEEALRQSEERFRSAAQSVISAQEEERGRVARELHDETGQSLTALLVGLRTVEDARTIEEAQSQAHRLRQIAAMTLDEVGRLAWGLRPRVLDDLGLAAALERYGAEFSASRGIAVNVHTKGMDASRLPFTVETALYRIAQEALTNTAKHAKAETVGILVERHTIFVQMMVEDDGCGFDVDAILKSGGASKHLGLHGMHERAALLKGTIRIESRPGKGTLIEVRIPLSTE